MEQSIPEEDVHANFTLKPNPDDHDRIKELEAKVSEDEKERKFFTALSKLQMDVMAVKKESFNPYHKSKYSKLESLNDHIAPFLKKYGFVKYTCDSIVDGERVLTTTLKHIPTLKSISCTGIMPKIDPKDPQRNGTCITYSIRYHLMSMFQFGSEDAKRFGEEDDDGNRASVPLREQEKNKTQPKSSEIDGMKKQLIALANSHEIGKKWLIKILKERNKKTVDDLIDQDVVSSIKWIKLKIAEGVKNEK